VKSIPQKISFGFLRIHLYIFRPKSTLNQRKY